MTGTFINVATVLVGGSIGLLFSARIPERVNKTVMAGIGLFTVGIGIQMFLKTQNSIIVLVSILVGGLLGEWWKIEDHLSNLGGYLENKFTKNEKKHIEIDEEGQGGSKFIQGFLTASLVFCVGPMTILGSIQDGLTGDYSLLAIKSVLDGFGAIAFAASMGLGVLFSSLIVLVFQGSISLLADQAQSFFTIPMMDEMTAVGGLLLIGLVISSLWELKPIRVGNFLPALFIAPLIVAILAGLGIG